MQEQDVQIINKLGLHARAAAALVKIASEFQSDISLAKDGNEVSSKNIMDVLMLAATKGTWLTVKTSGLDEDEAMSAVLELINNKFNESE